MAETDQMKVLEMCGESRNATQALRVAADALAAIEDLPDVRMDEAPEIARRGIAGANRELAVPWQDRVHEMTAPDEPMRHV
jgi:hypothetical protein